MKDKYFEILKRQVVGNCDLWILFDALKQFVDLSPISVDLFLAQIIQKVQLFIPKI